MIVKELVTEYLSSYTTTQSIKVRNPSIAKLHLTLLIFVCCAYLASINFDVRKIYQASCPLHGVALSKVKGHASTENLPDEELDVVNPNMYQKTWDAADLVFPVQGGEGETGSFTIVTNMIITPNQTRSICAGNPNKYGKTSCNNDTDCREGFASASTAGILTGKCVAEKGACEIKGWCPTEYKKLPRNGAKPLLEGVQEFTVFLKSTVEFPGCGDQQGRNVMTNMPLSYLKNCTYDAVGHPLCPIFRVGDIVKWSGVNFTDAAVQGSIFRINIKWDCDFDFGKTVKDCLPKYKFTSVDDKEHGSLGWNFRSAHYYSDDRRTLRKMFALKILISLEGEGRKFDLFTFVTTLGASTGVFCLAPFACDLILQLYNFWFRKSSSYDGRKLSLTLPNQRSKAQDYSKQANGIDGNSISATL